MEPTSELRALVDQMPDPDGRGMYTEIDKEQVEQAIAEIHRGGRENVLGLIEMLVPPGEGDDVKAHYALHCLAVHVCKLDDDAPRREFARAVASQIGGQRPKGVQRYLCRVLQVAGAQESVGALGAVLNDEQLCEPAAQALAAIGAGAGDQLRDALPSAGGKCRLTIVQNLGVVRDARSIAALKQTVGDEDRDVRLAAIWGLANIGDPGSVDLLLKAADTGAGYERTAATKACLLLAEKLLAADRRSDALRIYRHLRDTRTDPTESYIQEAAEKALAGAA